MNWPEYFRVRRSKRRWELLASIPSTVVSLGLGAYYLGNMETDPTKPIFGIDPIFVLGAATLGIGGMLVFIITETASSNRIYIVGVGYLLGPVIGSAAWRLKHRQILPLLEAREREFYKHIARNRVDPRTQSPTNPIPDYYGEKVGSLNQYRQWLRDQSNYRKKRTWAT
ncbi:hypothetical protein M422DRAFT_168336 [Sphaerobolus stellatus SS14]|uniref:Presequence translocated-associated motor subunit PAM17 n=1 Tax=Sphaerobolus stellatus (strain SS14) TaxID=990650 RepID=A0A0C9UMS4_SPHS4|nr:hypothetical protein M422DRAFT_168336 [Sphaerobolus stellatus SS14]